MKINGQELPECLKEIADALPLTLTREQAADVAKLSPMTIQRAVRSGAIKAIKTSDARGARVIIPRSSFLQWLAQRVM